MKKSIKLIPLLSLFLLNSCQNISKKEYIREYDSIVLTYSIISSNPGYHSYKSIKLNDSLFKRIENFLHTYLNNENYYLLELRAGFNPVNRFYFDFNYGDEDDFIYFSLDNPFLIGNIKDYNKYKNDDPLIITKETFDDMKELINEYNKVLEEVNWVDEKWSC